MGDEKKVNFPYLLLTATFDKSMHFFCRATSLFFRVIGKRSRTHQLESIGTGQCGGTIQNQKTHSP